METPEQQSWKPVIPNDVLICQSHIFTILDHGILVVLAEFQYLDVFVDMQQLIFGEPSSDGCISNCGTGIVKSEPAETFERIGYYEAFQSDRDCLQLSVEAIPDKYTMVHWAFADISQSFEPTVSPYEEAWVDFESEERFKKIVSFGGWAFSTGPTATTSTSEATEVISTSVISDTSQGPSDSATTTVPFETPIVVPTSSSQITSEPDDATTTVSSESPDPTPLEIPDPTDMLYVMYYHYIDQVDDVKSWFFKYRAAPNNSWDICDQNNDIQCDSKLWYECLEAEDRKLDDPPVPDGEWTMTRGGA
ncbi:hypothetical protein Q7P37_006005 [Cladosporium fusiforme]